MTRENSLERAIDALLTAIEQQELASLRWGYVDGSLSENEVEDLARVVLASNDEFTADDLLTALDDARLIVESSQEGTTRFRSRFAEGVRLVCRLRQLFPKRDWLVAPTLVSDYRIDSRPRRVPKRVHAPIEVTSALGLQPAELSRKIVEAILSTGDSQLMLSRFQLETTRSVLKEDGTDHGIVVSAGTGSGKTLAFYLPALARIGSLIQKGETWTKVVAIYPRIELLKDQGGEVFQIARRIDNALRADNRRFLTIGTLFRMTPERCDKQAIENAAWQRTASGFVCPFVFCPQCGGDLIWQDVHIAQANEKLTCSKRGCGFVATTDHIVLTRARARTNPPDIILTTVEMLHQRLSDTNHHAVLGLHPHLDRRARIVLLDEIHTYEGTTGAQSALALRRWRHAINRPITFVGLSATIREAGRFFGELTGLHEDRIVEVTPREEDLDEISPSYQLILRGDPASQANLLSTSIQAVFLLSRLLDPLHHGRSEGRFGSRLFAFTDDLDVTNRLFDDLRDAEAYNIFGQRDPKRNPLASERSSQLPNPRKRDAVGQNWRICEDIGWQLNQPLRISRTTAQDGGVDADSNVVVATSALEVGFDDARVGAILQHKSPHSLASFVQRKGRAGRTAAMRPWMVTVLSDYGRDRLTYQAYEQLFDPSVPPQKLPVRNRYILRMQAVFAMIDWFAVSARSSGLSGWWWHPLNGPTARQDERVKQEWLKNTLRRILRGEGNDGEQLARHLEGALKIPHEEVQALLWEPPRALMLEVIPTLVRRLATNWEDLQSTTEMKLLDSVAGPHRVHPLPDFIPPNLFSELNLPEVSIIVPPASVMHEERDEVMPIRQTLQQLGPGRVTRRFAFERGGLNHWVPVPLDKTEYDLSVGQYAERSEYVAHVSARIQNEIRSIACYRPLTIRLTKVASTVVSPSSHGKFDWSTEILPREEALHFPIPSVGWGKVIRSVDFYLHGFRSGITTRRFTTGGTATVRVPGLDRDHNVRTRVVTADGNPAALGFEQDVDGIRIVLDLPNPDTLLARSVTSLNLPAWRASYFRNRVNGDNVIKGKANSFQCDWLHQIFYSALIAEATRDGVSLAAAIETLKTKDATSAFGAAVETVFRIRLDDEPQDEDAHTPGKREQQLRDLLADSVLRQKLNELARDLWEPDPAAWRDWLAERVRETLGEALLFACIATAPRHAVFDTLLLDIGRGEATESETSVEIWITEATPGGNGVIESLVEALAADQRTLFTALESALVPSDLELASINLDLLVGLISTDAEVAASMRQVRACREHRDRTAARSELFRVLARRGLGAHHAFGVALEYRLLREGMDPAGDALLSQLLQHWRTLEASLGVAIDLRVYCYLAAIDNELGPRITNWLNTLNGTTLGVGERVGVLAGILWARPPEIRGRSLETYNPYRERGQTDPSLLQDLVRDEQVLQIRFRAAAWRTDLISGLAVSGRVELIAAEGEAESLRDELLSIIASPVDVDFLQFYPIIEQTTRRATSITVTLILREVAVG